MTNIRSLKFRSSFSTRLRTGKRCRALNTRTKKTEETNPVLLVDLNYLEELVVSKSQFKMSSLYNKDINTLVERCYSWILSAFKTVSPVGVLFTAETETEITKKITQPVIYGNVRNILYTILKKQQIKEPICILTNNIELWALASPSANVSFMAIDSNNRILYYNNKTGLDIVSRFIGTYKIINKLKLDTLKYLNLQYLYILLFYIKFTEAKQSPDFYFDGTFFKTRNLSKPFLKSKGFGLELITTSHKFLSYAFLTKPEFLDYFLLGTSGHFSANLNRLQKLLSFDILLLEHMKNIYDHQYQFSLIELPKANIQPAMPPEFTFSKKLPEKINNSLSKPVDTMDVASYVTNLLGF